MTDDDLVKQLVDWSEYDEGKINDTRLKAANRIEALQAERDELRAELAKLEDELTDALAFKDCACAHDTPTDICLGHNRLFERVFGKRLEAAIAKLKGNKDE